MTTPNLAALRATLMLFLVILLAPATAAEPEEKSSHQLWWEFLDQVTLPGLFETNPREIHIDEERGYLYRVGRSNGSAAGQFSKYRIRRDSEVVELLGSVAFPPDNHLFQTSVADFVNGYAYIGTQTSPGRILVVSLGEGDAPPAHVRSITLPAGEDSPICSVIDPDRGFALFGCYTSPGRVVKISLEQPGFSANRVGALTLNAGENNLLSAAYDPGIGHALFGTHTSPGRVIRVNPRGAGELPTRVGAVTLNTGENSLHNGAMHQGTTHAYFVTTTTPARIVKVWMRSLSIAPSRVAATTLPANVSNTWNVAVDNEAGMAYMSMGVAGGQAAPRILRVELQPEGLAPVLRESMFGVPATMRALTVDQTRGHLYGAAGSVLLRTTLHGAVGFYRGDFNTDRCVNFSDFIALLDHWAASFKGESIGFLDFIALLEHWGLGCS